MSTFSKEVSALRALDSQTALPIARGSRGALYLRESIVLNRAVLILRYKQPFVDWINAADPNPTHELTLADVNDDSTAYLVEVEDEKEFEKWFKLNGVALFEDELNGWYTDPDLWPQDRTGALFKKWCTFELHTLVHDTGGEPLFDDET